MLEKYFSRVPAGPKPEDMTTVEPPQFAEKSVIIREQTQPFYIEGYHRPNYRDPDDAVYDAISDIMSNGRVSRLYRSLVEQQQIAAEAEGFSPFPGEKYPSLFAFYAVPLPGHTPAEMRDAIHKEIDKLKTADVTDAELQMYKTRARADLLRGLADNQGLANSLAEYQTRYGDWRQLFLQLDEVDKVTKADIRRVANQDLCGLQPHQRGNRHRAAGRGRQEGWRRAMTKTGNKGSRDQGSDNRISCQSSGIWSKAANRDSGSIVRGSSATGWYRRSPACCSAVSCSRQDSSLACLPHRVAFSLSAQQSKPWEKIPIPPLHAFHPQQPKRIELKNGIVIFLQEDHELPFVSGSVLIPGGSRDEDPAKAGLVGLYGRHGAPAAPRRWTATPWTTCSKPRPRTLKPTATTTPPRSPGIR